MLVGNLKHYTWQSKRDEPGLDWFVSIWIGGRAVNWTGKSSDEATAWRALLQTRAETAAHEDGVLVGQFAAVRVGKHLGNMVSGFADPTVSDAEIRRRIEAAFAHTRETEVIAMRSSLPKMPSQPLKEEQSSTKYRTPSGSIGVQWQRISKWMQEHLRFGPNPGVHPEQVTAAMAATGIDWPSELRELFTLVNSFPHDQWVPLFPAYELFDLDRVVAERQLELKIWGQLDAEMNAHRDDGTPAGSIADTYLPEFIPFAGVDGNLCVLDMRPGPLHGCVSMFYREGPDVDGPRWLSLSAMLTDLADSLENGTAFDGGWYPTVHNRDLGWEWRPPRA